MTAQRHPGTLPIRRWLALALIVIFILPLFVTLVFTVAWVRGDPHYDRAQAVRVLSEGSHNWDDPDWRAATAADLARQNVAFVLYEDGQEIYRSADNPFAVAGEQDRERIVEQVVIPGSEPDRVAHVYADPDFGPPEEVPIELLPFVGLAALALTLGGIAWFLGSALLKPLAATSEGARSVASGNLDIELPSSRVREVAELIAAFESMSVDLRASLQQQAAMEQERRLLIGAVVHDLRTPLFSLRGYLEGLETGVADTPDKQRQYVAVAQEKADALERLIADLFDYTRLEYLDETPVREPLDLTSLLDSLVSGLAPQAEAKGVEIELVTSAACVVHGDRHLLTRAIENLLDNALRHTPAGGAVQAACDQDGERTRFTISDSGPGIPEEDLPHIFTPMFRGEVSRNRRTGGAGLGLTIARRMLRAQGGDLEAANAPGGGAVFTGWLPAAQFDNGQSR